MGSKTTKAIKRYQSANNLPVTGSVSLQLLEHMEARVEDGGSSRDMLTTAPY
jgi:peptidoglycan hydrolase-like protein with peptidoglycan-binding domain